MRLGLTRVVAVFKKKRAQTRSLLVSISTQALVALQSIVTVLSLSVGGKATKWRLEADQLLGDLSSRVPRESRQHPGSRFSAGSECLLKTVPLKRHIRGRRALLRVPGKRAASESRPARNLAPAPSARLGFCF